ncbi:MAG: glutamyl-tRNA reductase [Actinomycetes bacterium]
MSLVVVGLNHRNAPVGLLEQVSVSGRALPKALHDLVSREHVAEAVLVSTCNRTEVYVRATLFHPGVDDVRHFLAEVGGIDPETLAELIYAYHDEAAVAHLFAVTAGLDSMIIGEHEIQGQVREAWRVAEDEHTTGPLLSRTFRQAIEVGKRARTETGIGRYAVSVSSAAVTLAADRLGSLEGRRVLVIGAGKMGEQTAVALSGAGVGEIVVANRTPERAQAVAERVGGRAIGLEQIAETMVTTDVLLSCTGADEVLVTRTDIEAAMRARHDRAMLLIDVAVPRDIDPGVAQVFGVTLLDIDALRALGEHSLQQRRAEVGRVREIIADEIDRYRAERSAREVAPLITALRERAEAIRTAEIERRRAAIDDPAVREIVESITRGLVNKLLHEPTVRLRDAAGSSLGETYADTLAELFALAPPSSDG